MLILVLTVTGWVSVPAGIKKLWVGIEICAITAGIIKYKSVIKKKKKQ